LKMWRGCMLEFSNASSERWVVGSTNGRRIEIDRRSGEEVSAGSKPRTYGAQSKLGTIYLKAGACFRVKKNSSQVVLVPENNTPRKCRYIVQPWPHV